jgi:hypothetical protein
VIRVNVLTTAPRTTQRALASVSFKCASLVEGYAQHRLKFSDPRDDARNKHVSNPSWGLAYTARRNLPSARKRLVPRPARPWAGCPLQFLAAQSSSGLLQTSAAIRQSADIGCLRHTLDTPSTRPDGGKTGISDQSVCWAHLRHALGTPSTRLDWKLGTRLVAAGDRQLRSRWIALGASSS